VEPAITYLQVKKNASIAAAPLGEMSVITKNSKKNQFKYHSSPNNSTQ